ncbi:TPA: hypothetical protein ACKONR_001284 [Clostridioides difficile]|uniref:hypothetical protein n=1 Tax=Clostridioides difficile TaxID=1496 RepID=UPI00038CA1F8|nr:hypothetical protein [Clostridioides difficile]AXU29126.1 hypothetical protein CDIF102859_03454 [Clostridioides difficile]AXU32914.1 hypothetical protein CDIF102860_03469 [Clostridioides difficile]AXU36702.1 hypothetical protein CDIF102978_03469 [Clostridioides difficile]EQE83565.1 hypothetical protein QCW_3173 [Clostridioides difficile CD69]MCP8413288.1 hypothetical protein [Clostridioides difficile]
MNQIELDLYHDMVNIYKEADLQCNYKPTRFLQLINNKGALLAAKELINKEGVTEGFTRLWECKRLDLSLEVLVLKEKYKELFTDEERKICINRLKDYGYKFN